MIREYLTCKYCASSRRCTWIAAACDIVCAFNDAFTGYYVFAALFIVMAISILVINFLAITHAIERHKEWDEFTRDNKMDLYN